MGYTHVDVSDQFSDFGKWSVASIVLFTFSLRKFVALNNSSSFEPTCITLCGALAMVVARKVNLFPVFDIRSNIFMEPLCVIFGMMLLSTYYNGDGFQSLLRYFLNTSENNSNNINKWKLVLCSTIGSALFMSGDSIISFLLEVATSNKSEYPATLIALLLTTSANIGSALTITGSVHNVLIATVIYDTLDWFEFFLNMAQPVIVCSIVNASIIILFCSSNSSRNTSSCNYQEASSFDLCNDEEDIDVAKENGGDDNGVGASDDDDAVQQQHVTSFNIDQDCDNIIQNTNDDDIACSSTVSSCGTSTKQSSKTQKIAETIVVVGLFAILAMSICKDSNIGNIIIAPICGGIIIVLIKHNNHPSTNLKNILKKIDYSATLLPLLGDFILIGSLNDTGLPQLFFAGALGQCAEQPTEGIRGGCIYRFISIICFLTNALSWFTPPLSLSSSYYGGGGVSTVQMLAATFPYFAPYDWLVVSFAISMSNNLSSCCFTSDNVITYLVANNKVTTTRDSTGGGNSNSISNKRYIPIAFVSTFSTLFIGAFCIVNIHFSPECSQRLGECD